MDYHPWSIAKEDFFMLMKEFIEMGAAKAGSLTGLGRMLGISQPDMSNAKAMKKPLPAKAVVQLADYIGADLHAVIAANELVTEKDEAKRAYWRPFVEHARAASLVLALALVTNFVTPTSAEAAPAKNQPVAGFVLCKLRKLWRILKQGQLTRRNQGLRKRIAEALETILPPRVAQI